MPAVAGDGGDGKKNPYRGGFVRVGPFFVTGIDTTIQINSQRGILGTRIDLNRDLGMKNSDIVGRLDLAYRFNKRHRLDFEWYKISRAGTKTLERTIRIGDREFLLGTTVESFIDTEILRTSYAWIFHDEGKVMLALNVGLYVTAFDVGVRAAGTGPGAEEGGSLTAPLPVLGGRLVYRVKPKLNLVASVDWFFINYSDYKGSMNNALVFVQHHTFKHVGFGGGLERMAVDIEADSEDWFGDLSHIQTGWVAYAVFYF